MNEDESTRGELQSLFRAHATARLRGDTAETRRLAARIPENRRMQHVLFVLTLLTQAVVEYYGSAPDPSDLAELTKRLHGKHFRTDPNFDALRAEAMIRAVCGESVILTEIPYSEQPGYMWAAMCELVDPRESDAELAERFAEAEEAGLACLTEAFEATILNHPGRPEKAPHTLDHDREAPQMPEPGPEAPGKPVFDREAPRAEAQRPPVTEAESPPQQAPASGIRAPEQRPPATDGASPDQSRDHVEPPAVPGPDTASAAATPDSGEETA